MQRLRWLFVLPLLFLSAIAAAQPASVTGTVTYRERIAMPAGAVVEITIEDVSRVDAPATVVSAMRIDDPGQVPIRFDLGYDPIWFGVVMVIVLEMGLISPPVGMNVFVVKGFVADVPMRQIFSGILPFWAAMLVCLLLLVVFPQIALFLPDTMIK